MIKHVLLFAACLGLAQAGVAQQAFGKLVAGVEVGFDVAQYTAGIRPKLIPGVQLEVPLGRFSFGVGAGRKFYNKYEYYTFNGQTTERIENEQSVLYYLADVHAFHPAYWTVPVKIDYRFHRCHCVYVHLGMAFDFLDERPKDQIVFQNAELRDRPLESVRRDQLFKKRTRSYEFGVGFKLHSNDYFRIVARPSYVLSENPEIYTDAPKYIGTVRMTFGFQYAFIRYE